MAEDGAVEVARGRSAPDDPASPEPSRRGLLAALPVALPALTALAVGVSMARRGAAFRPLFFEGSWQLVELSVLRDDPVGSVWYLHTQPPLFNLVIGSVLRWSPTPPYGTLMVLSLICLGLTGVIVADLLVRWRLHPVAAALLGALAIALPAPVATIILPSYEVPLATLVAAALWLVQRHLDRPGPIPLVALSLVLTTLAMTRSLFHPVWVLAVLALVAVARPVPWKVIGASVAIPLLVVGGWMGKNQVLFGEPTLSSWFGFNLQRGVTAPLDADLIDDEVASGRVSPEARVAPFQALDAYRVACAPDRRHPALTSEVKLRTDLLDVANWNNPCYLPLYRGAADDAATLVRRHPGAYLRTRSAPYVLAFRTTDVGVDDPVVGLSGARQAETTWMDRLGGALLVPVTVHISLEGWTVPILPAPEAGPHELTAEVSLTLVLATIVVVARGLVGLVRLARRWRTRAEDWAGEEVAWVVLLTVVGLAVGVSGLVELGENERFRATVDPFLVALPLALLVRSVTSWREL